MTEEEKRASNKAAGSGNVRSGPTDNQLKIERRVEDIFRKFEDKPDDVPKEQKIIDDFPDIKIEIAEKVTETPRAAEDIPKSGSDTDISKPHPDKIRPKIFRPVYVVGAVLVAATAITLITIYPRQTPDKPATTESVHKIVRPVPQPPIQSGKVEPAQPVPRDAPDSKEIKAFLMKWKTAWENTAGKEGDLETFMSFYSDNFTSQGMNKSRWRTDKAQKNSLKEWIRLELKNVRIAEPASDNRIEIGFLLDYNSSNYSDETHQSMILIKEAGNWKIVEMKAADENE